MNEIEDTCTGIDGLTGAYLSAPSDHELAASFTSPILSRSQKRMYRWWIERYGIHDPYRAPTQLVDPTSIESAGWGVIFSPDIDTQIEKALSPLLSHRREQAGALFKQYTYVVGQTKIAFLQSAGAAPGPADPRKMPYYLLLVGSPSMIPFDFQHDLDVEYAVGRVHFETVEQYAYYAHSVVEAELNRHHGDEDKEIAFFSPTNAPLTPETPEAFIKPLAASLTQNGIPIRVLLGQEADKSNLKQMIGGGSTPSLLLSVNHGLSFPPGHALQRNQGALLCSDWPGHSDWKGMIPNDYYFSSDDVGHHSLLGLIAIHIASYSIGTPEFDFPEHSRPRPPRTALSPFVSSLAQRLLSHPEGGALAALGYSGRAWTAAFHWSEHNNRSEILKNVLDRLLQGHPIGSATEYINQRQVALSLEADNLITESIHHQSSNAKLLARTWKAAMAAQSFMVFGDPAVKLMHRG